MTTPTLTQPVGVFLPAVLPDDAPPVPHGTHLTQTLAMPPGPTRVRLLLSDTDHARVTAPTSRTAHYVITDLTTGALWSITRVPNAFPQARPVPTEHRDTREPDDYGMFAAVLPDDAVARIPTGTEWTSGPDGKAYALLRVARPTGRRLIRAAEDGQEHHENTTDRNTGRRWTIVYRIDPTHPRGGEWQAEPVLLGRTGSVKTPPAPSPAPQLDDEAEARRLFDLADPERKRKMFGISHEERATLLRAAQVRATLALLAQPDPEPTIALAEPVAHTVVFSLGASHVVCSCGEVFKESTYAGPIVFAPDAIQKWGKHLADVQNGATA